jgi:hypothetical protein
MGGTQLTNYPSYLAATSFNRVALVAQGMDYFLCMRDHMIGMYSVNVFANLRFDFMNKSLQFSHDRMDLSPPQSGLSAIEFGKQAVGHPLVIDVSHFGCVSYTVAQGLDCMLGVKTFLAVTGKHRSNGQETNNDQNECNIE